MIYFKEKFLRILSAIVFLIIVGGCATIEKNILFTSQELIDKAQQKNFRKVDFTLGDFTLTGYHKLRVPTASTLSVYIEGDGDPIAFFLAGEDSYVNVLYLVPPVQSYSPEIINAFNSVIDQMKLSTGAQKVSLTGYSDGGAFAVLVAASRNDVSALRTVAGNLAFVPLTVAAVVKNIPQRHFVGARDVIVPKVNVKNFLEAQKDKARKGMSVIKGAGHINGWVERWSELLKYPLRKIEKDKIL